MLQQPAQPFPALDLSIREEELLSDGIVTFSDAAVMLSCSLRTVERLVYTAYLPGMDR